MPDRDDEDELQELIEHINSEDLKKSYIAVQKAVKMLLQERRDREVVFKWITLAARYAGAAAAGALIIQQFSHQVREWIVAWIGTVR